MRDPLPARPPFRAPPLLLAASLALALAACQDAVPRDPKLGDVTPGPDTIPTAVEVRASLTGAAALGAEAYVYRGLYAGMDREHLEAALGSGAGTCEPPPKSPTEMACSYEGTLGTDHAAVHVSATYAAAVRGVRKARELSVVRELPLDVDGVRLAGELADAFEGQTRLLDSRDASFGRHVAHVRMGTLNGARQNFVAVDVATHAGREELTVRLARGAKP